VCWFEELVFVLPSEVLRFFSPPSCLFFSSEKFDRLLRLREFGSKYHFREEVNPIIEAVRSNHGNNIRAKD
jgi:hypothetical protein